MVIFDLVRQPDINKGVRDYRKTGGAVLLDVRTPKEYREGRIPESENVPLQELDKIDDVVENKDTPLFVYCYSGGRSRQAAVMLEHMGYTRVQNIGGIMDYSGKGEW